MEEILQNDLAEVVEETGFTSEKFNKMNRKQRLKAAQKNMRAALDSLKLGKKEKITEFFDIDDNTLDKRILKSNWTWAEVNEVVGELGVDDKLKLFNPAGFFV